MMNDSNTESGGDVAEGHSPGAAPSRHHGVSLASSTVVRNARPAVLFEHALANREGILTGSGALAVDTGVYTGRSPTDKFVVHNEATAADVDWGSTNQPMSQEHFDRLLADMQRHADGRRVYVQDLQAGSAEPYRLTVRVVTEY